VSNQEDLEPLWEKLLLLDEILPSHSGEPILYQLKACAFTLQEVRKIQSPLLNGLWAIVTGQDPQEKRRMSNGWPWEHMPAVCMSDLLHLALKPRFYPATAEYFIQRGADPSSALLSLGGVGDVAIFSFLLDQGAVVAQYNGRILSDACKTGNGPAVAVLLANGADTFADNGSALIAASANGHAAVVSLLLTIPSLPRQPSIASTSGLNAVHRASTIITGADNLPRPRQSDAGALMGHPSTPLQAISSPVVSRPNQVILDQALLEAVDHNHANVAVTLIQFGADPKSYNDSLAWRAFTRHHSAVAKVLVEAGAGDDSFRKALLERFNDRHQHQQARDAEENGRIAVPTCRCC